MFSGAENFQIDFFNIFKHHSKSILSLKTIKGFFFQGFSQAPIIHNTRNSLSYGPRILRRNKYPSVPV